MKPLFGPEIVHRFLPQARPFLMVDHVLAFSRKRAATLTASRLISGNDPVFEGHLPGLMLWPGVYTLEALAQTTNLLLAMTSLAEQVGDDAQLIAQLLRLRSALRLQPVAGAELPELPDVRRFGVLSAVDVKLTAPVFAGDTLVCTSTHRERFGDAWIVDVEASVDRRPVARGSLHVALREAPPGMFGGAHQR